MRQANFPIEHGQRQLTACATFCREARISSRSSDSSTVGGAVAGDGASVLAERAVAAVLFLRTGRRCSWCSFAPAIQTHSSVS